MKQLHHTKDILLKEDYLNVYLIDGDEEQILVSKIRSIYIKVNNRNKKSLYFLLGFFFSTGLTLLFLQVHFLIILTPVLILVLIYPLFYQNRYMLVVENNSGINYNFPFPKKSKGEIVDELRNVRTALNSLKKNKLNVNLALT